MPEEKTNPFMGIHDVEQAEGLVSRFQREHPNDYERIEEFVIYIVEALFATDDQLNGSADAFHNFAVTISKTLNENDRSLSITLLGLKIHPHNTDLLADAILYGRKCGKVEDCLSYYNRLLNIDKRHWTWRAFSFSIDFLLEEYGLAQRESITYEDIIQLCKDYQSMLPQEEDAWVSLSEVYMKIKENKLAEQTLIEAVETFMFCPKCWLRYADMLIDRGDYEKASPIVKKMVRNVNSIEDINTSYMYYLDALCRMQIMYNSDEFQDAIDDGDVGEIYQKEVFRIYKAFRRSLTSSGLRETTKQKIDDHINRITIDTNLSYPQDWYSK